MNDDILPSLLKEVQDKFEAAYGKSDIISSAFAKLKSKKATYATVNEFAIEIGEILSKALTGSVSSSNLPDGKMYYNIAQRLLTETLGRNYEIISGYAGDVQKLLNDEAKIGLAVQVPDINQERIDGLVNRLSFENHFDDVAWMLGEPIVNFSQNIVDDSIKVNAEFHGKAGLSPQIVRKEGGKCCDWCREVVGVYRYPKVPQDVYRRHNHCRCTVDYHPGNGKKQNVHSKFWSDPLKNAKIEARKQIGLPIQAGAKNYFRDESNDDILPKDFIKAEKHAYITYDRIKNSNQELEKRKIYSNIGKFKEMKDFTKEDVDIAFNHVFNDVHNLRDGQGLFHPEINMAESWNRLISGKDIQPHDLILLKHERLEHDYMYVKGSMDYDNAHAKTDETYNYGSALVKYLERKNNGKI
ncbi:TPA: hypothetical protein ACYSZK_000755 [Streptococcus suis]|uniref:hypothetical protein n=1 Tax=Streptococcus suis TaxID=1307 RepID=UPI001DFE9C1A|nr:hypothetical protein [Streptococcus suis]MDY7591322.1 hypothetical protein [Streptococcus suis]NRG58335.1 hypothetical protein [Streptococcus suis]NRH05207.1 hypothetical protein [Streptococcus suis]HEL2235832.1 hypothetical protein [Streptococcus suis]HEL2239801.1 hypothetical protein [Streptococcus suis]